MAAKTNRKTKIEVIKPSEEDLILGAQEEVKTVQVVDYLSPDVHYNVTVVETGRQVEVNGREIGTFLGQNSRARKQLEEGETNIIVLDSKGYKQLYKIEVLH